MEESRRGSYLINQQDEGMLNFGHKEIEGSSKRLAGVDMFFESDENSPRTVAPIMHGPTGS